MTGAIDLLSDVRSITPCPVGLPNGDQTTDVKEGKMHLGENTYLQNVLYVPNMNCTLIYVSKLMQDLKCVVTFSNKLCVMQDQTLRTLIKVSEECNGVFLFRRIILKLANKVEVKDCGKLWHHRLGHPSKQILACLPEEKGSSLDDFCDVCYKAKQTRDVFPESSN